MPKKASFTDYFDIQGGKPLITKGKDGLWRIKHEYREDEPEVVTHISPEARGTVVLSTSNGPREFDVASLWNFEGKPCEERSRSVGGDTYTRHGSSENKG